MDQGTQSKADGITFGGSVQMDNSGSIVEKNLIYNFTDTGIDTVEGQNITIRYNLVHTSVVGDSSGDGDAYKLDTDNENVGIVMHHNIGHSVSHTGIIYRGSNG